ncbi:MAG: maltose/moltooligosaccharide transporter, partial [Tenuifilum sp.]|uniref:MFS transporter n=1 Tax=Tenuifilum sp. TaxID=2760880 RepID=UPI0024ABEF35
FNVTFQPFRSLVADMTPDEQTNTGYSIQTLLINLGAVIGSFLPFVLTNWLGVENTAPKGSVPPSVIWSFYIGGSILLVSVLWTVFTTKEYNPEEFKQYNPTPENSVTEKQSFWQTLMSMPGIMGKLAVVQFFSWFALFAMWVYTTPAVAQHIWGTAIGDSSSLAYNEAANWVGVLFGLYSVFAALFSIFLDKIANSLGRVKTYSFSLLLGAIGYLSMYIFTGQYALIFSMVGVGIAWAAILAMPYAILARSLPADRMGVYMGIFNITVVVPQIVSGLLLGTILKFVFHEKAIYMIVLAGISMLIAAISAILFVKESKA